MHPVLDQLIKALGGAVGFVVGEGWGAGGPGGEGGPPWLLAGPKAGGEEPESRGVEDRGPGAAVMQPGRVDGLWGVERPAWTHTQIQTQIQTGL